MTVEMPPRPHRGWTFHEVPVGKRWSTSRRTVTETDLMVYATQFGFVEGLFLDATGSERAGYSGRLVPGSLVMSIAEGLIISGGAIAEVTEARMTSSGDRGIVTTRNEVFNQDEQVVMVYTPTRMIRTEHVDD